MRFIMSFTRNLNKLLLVGAVLVEINIDGNCSSTSIGETSDISSYHLFQGSPHPEIIVSPTTKDSLSKELASCSEKFQSADCTDQIEVAENLIPRLKTVFFGKKDTSVEDKIASLELDVFKGKNILEAVPIIVNERQGLPQAAYYVACMYDQEGIYRVALLWSKVAYELGIHEAKNLGRELITKIGM